MKTKSASQLRREQCLRSLASAKTQGDVMMALVTFADEQSIRRAVFNAMTIITAEYGSDPQVTVPERGSAPTEEIHDDITVKLPTEYTNEDTDEIVIITEEIAQ